MQAADKHPGRFLWVEFEFKCLVFGENKEHKGFFFFFFFSWKALDASRTACLMENTAYK